jgi:fumarate reductase flavoprotein subunit
MSVDPDFDVVVIGAGGAGLAAAVGAAEQERTVLVIEAADRVGGATALAGGSFMVAGTPAQAEIGHPGDTADAFFDHYLTFNRWEIDPAVARRFCDEALSTYEWLVGLGLRFTADGLYRATRESAPRSHRPVGGGAAIVEVLHREASRLGVDVALSRRVDGLELGPGGAPHLVHAAGEQVSAHAVIVTTGGFGANPELVAEHIPDAQGDPVWSPTAPTCRGDGLALLTALGAATSGRNHGDLLLTAGLVTEIEPFVPPWLMIVGRDGRRFVDESAPYPVLTPLGLRNGPCWVILDDQQVRSAKPNPTSAWGAGTWTADTLRQAVGDGRVRSADTIEGLAASTGLPERALAAAVARYNLHCARGHDVEFGKRPEGLVPIEHPPFHAVALAPAVVALTGYGPRIDPHGRVLAAADGDPIPGLYAAGEVTGNVLGPQYLGGGNAIGSALIFGRIAGRHAASDHETARPASATKVAR